MNVLAFAQGKGGVGKSASCINLATTAVANKFSAAIVDLDLEQGTSLKWSRRRNGKDQPIVVKSDAASLPEVLSDLKARGVQWVFLDLPGRASAISSAGIRAADLVIVPCRPLDVDIEASMTTVQAAKGTHKPYAYLMNIAPGQHDRRRAKQVQGFLRAHGHNVADTIVVQRIMVPDAIAEGLGISEAKPDSESSQEFAALFDWLRREIK